MDRTARGPDRRGCGAGLGRDAEQGAVRAAGEAQGPMDREAEGPALAPSSPQGIQRNAPAAPTGPSRGPGLDEDAIRAKAARVATDAVTRGQGQGGPIGGQVATPVAFPVLPRFEDFVDLARTAWDRGRLTNDGPLVRQLEVRLAEIHQTPGLRLVSSGTRAIEVMLRSCSLPGRSRIVLTPFSFVATLDAVLWLGFQPVFVDLRPGTLMLDAEQVEAALARDDIAAVLTAHPWGRAGDDGRLARTCRAHGVPLLFDAAHCFAIMTERGPLVRWGTASALSLHATKTFGTVEGGAVISGDEGIVERVTRMRAFGVVSESASDLGTNAKMSELHAAFGLASLGGYEAVRTARQERWRHYQRRMPPDVEMIDVEAPPITRANYGYATVVFPEERRLLSARSLLQGEGFASRRYFHPALGELPFLPGRSETPVASDLSRRVLTLPLSHELPLDRIERIARLLGQAG